MSNTDKGARILARLIYGDDGAAVSSREELEAILLPMIRVALRTGRGEAVLVEWVEENLPAVAPAARFGRAVDFAWAAPRLARLLLSGMLQAVWAGRDAAEACETVVAV